MGVQGPREIVEGEETVLVELDPSGHGLLPLAVEDLSLFLEIDVLVQSIVVELTVRDHICSGS